MDYDIHSGGLIGAKRDYVEPNARGHRSDPYYLFRKGRKGQFGIQGSEAYYTDRVQSADRALYEKACGHWIQWRTRPPLNGDFEEECQKAAKILFGEDTVCVGFAVGENVSSGYPYGIFFLKPKKNK